MNWSSVGGLLHMFVDAFTLLICSACSFDNSLRQGGLSMLETKLAYACASLPASRTSICLQASSMELLRAYSRNSLLFSDQLCLIILYLLLSCHFRPVSSLANGTCSYCIWRALLRWMLASTFCKCCLSSSNCYSWFSRASSSRVGPREITSSDCLSADYCTAMLWKLTWRGMLYWPSMRWFCWTKSWSSRASFLTAGTLGEISSI